MSTVQFRRKIGEYNLLLVLFGEDKLHVILIHEDGNRWSTHLIKPLITMEHPIDIRETYNQLCNSDCSIRESGTDGRCIFPDGLELTAHTETNIKITRFNNLLDKITNISRELEKVKSEVLTI